jgi:GT2 family glycosyltransferase
LKPLFSLIITTSNRPHELKFSLNHIIKNFDLELVEILVVVDGCEKTKQMKKIGLERVDWYYLDSKIGASRARNFIYKRAKGKYLIGLDDDANLISENSLDFIIDIFNGNPNAGIIAFEEIRAKIIESLPVHYDSEVIKVNDFVGCGFCIRKDVYDETRGFPIWMDIYGEESCVSIEVIEKGYDIIYTSKIKVHHRVDKIARSKAGHGVYRFTKSLINGNKYFLVYYPNSILFKYLIKIFLHNLSKYAFKNGAFFLAFFKAYIILFIDSGKLKKFRKPVSIDVIKRIKKLNSIPY